VPSGAAGEFGQVDNLNLVHSVFSYINPGHRDVSLPACAQVKKAAWITQPFSTTNF